MAANLRMLWFHVGQFAKNSYFVQLLFTSTLTILALSALAARNPGAGATSDLVWLRAGMLGTWTMCAVAVGLLSYQRFQGTLVHLIRTPHAPVRTLLPVVGAASVFGLLALPVAALGAWLLRLPIATGNLGTMLIAGLGFWLACLAISSTIGMLFKIITPNALTYENLVGIPIVLVSGVFGTPLWLPSGITQAARILPTRSAVQVLTDVASGHSLNWLALAETLAVSAVWLTATAIIAGVVARRATVTGTLEVV